MQGSWFHGYRGNTTSLKFRQCFIALQQYVDNQWTTLVFENSGTLNQNSWVDSTVFEVCPAANLPTRIYFSAEGTLEWNQSLASNNLSNVPVCEFYGYIEYTRPINNSYMLIGYDGLATNFGDNKTVYIGNQGTYINYGNHTTRFSSSGFQRYVGSSSLGTIGGDTAISNYLSSWVNLHHKAIRNISGPGNSSLNLNDEIITFANNGTLVFNLGSPSTFPGKIVRLVKLGSASGSVTVNGTNMIFTSTGTSSSSFTPSSWKIYQIVSIYNNWLISVL